STPITTAGSPAEPEDPSCAGRRAICSSSGVDAPGRTARLRAGAGLSRVTPRAGAGRAAGPFGASPTGGRGDPSTPPDTLGLEAADPASYPQVNKPGRPEGARAAAGEGAAAAAARARPGGHRRRPVLPGRPQ